MPTTTQDKITSLAILALRKQKLSQNIPFMINSEILEPHQCFLEYPDGSIKIAEADSNKCDFKILFEYNSKDLHWLRQKLNLPRS